MDTRLTTTHGVWRLLTATIVALALVMALGATSVSAASPSACRVQNTASGKTYQKLQAAVDAARKGDRLAVKGTCVGESVIDRGVVVVGVHQERTGTPRLSGAKKSRVLDIGPGVRVKLRDLEIVRGSALRGAGIRNLGSLILADVRIRGNWNPYDEHGVGYGRGGGVLNRGTVRAYGASRVSDNHADGRGSGVLNTGTFVLAGSSVVAGNSGVYGVGVDNMGTFIMRGSSAIKGNYSTDSAGGVSNSGTFVMHDTSSIRHNGPAWYAGAGGVSNGESGTFVMHDASSIAHNVGGIEGGSGGVENEGTFTMNGASSISGHRQGAVGNGGRFTMNDTSSIRDNSEGCSAAGLWNGGRFTMTGSASITGNVLTGIVVVEGDGNWECEESVRGAGVYHARGRLVGVTCGPGGNVYGNTPDDCHVESP